MNTDELRTALHATAAEIAPPSDVVSRARHGGRRRLHRRRAAFAGGIAVGAALALGGTLIGHHVTRPVPADPPSTVADLTSGPTRGNLAGDDEAVAAARAGYADNTDGGHSHLAWLGRTRYGQVAVFARRDRSRHGVVSVVTLYRPTGGRYRNTDAALVHLSSGPAVSISADSAAWAVPVFSGKAEFVLDFGAPVYYSTRHRYTRQATRRVWQRVRFHGGAALLPTPAGRTMLVASSDRPGAEDVIDDDRVRGLDDRTLRWEGTPRAGGGHGGATPIPATPHAGRLPWARNGGAVNTFLDALRGSPFERPFDDPLASTSFVPWVVYGQTPDGQRFAVGELQLDSEPSHLYALVGHTVRYVGASDRTETLPVRVKLPHGRWVVAAKGKTLAYRDGGGWHDAGRDAALVPAGTTEVRVDGTAVPLEQ